MTHEQEVSTALELVAPSASARECRAHIEEALAIMKPLIEADKRAKTTKKSMSGYSAALQRMLVASKKHRDAGGALVIPHGVIERAAAFDEKWSAHWSPYPRSLGQDAVALAYELLSRWNPDAISIYVRAKDAEKRGGRRWNDLAAFLCGAPGRNLYRQIQAFAKQIRERQK